MEKKEYAVHFVLVREVLVEASDDIQAELDAFAKLKAADRDCVIGSHVAEDGDGEGALAENPMDAMKFVRDKFGAIDREWLESSRHHAARQ